MAALQQAVALLQMGNMLEGYMRKSDMEERKNCAILQQNQPR